MSDSSIPSISVNNVAMATRGQRSQQDDSQNSLESFDDNKVWRSHDSMGSNSLGGLHSSNSGELSGLCGGPEPGFQVVPGFRIKSPLDRFLNENNPECLPKPVSQVS